jgi:hypothetical protein
MDTAQTCNQTASVQYLPGGARIAAPDTSLFTIGRTDLSACGQYILSGVVQSMLDPRIMQVVVEPGGDINAPDAFLPRERAVIVGASPGFVGQGPSFQAANTWELGDCADNQTRAAALKDRGDHSVAKNATATHSLWFSNRSDSADDRSRVPSLVLGNRCAGERIRCRRMAWHSVA